MSFTWLERREYENTVRYYERALKNYPPSVCPERYARDICARWDSYSWLRRVVGW